jgi:uncharacterized RDD family membrane protein YckC
VTTAAGDLTTSGRDPGLAVSQQGHYANAVTRLAAFAIDQSLATGLFAVTTAVIAWAISLVTSDAIKWNPSAAFTGLLLLCWLFIYYSYPWAVSGKTPGMALLGIRVVRSDGATASVKNAVLRTLALPLSFLTLGIGFLPIIFGKQHRALHDSIANTAVVYSWDARAARLRFLARQQRADEATPTS